MTNISYSEDRRFPQAVILMLNPLDFQPVADARLSYPLQSFGRIPEAIPPTDRRWGSDPFVGAGINIIDIINNQTEDTFSALYDQWRAERGATSSITEMVMCKAHIQIIALGPSVIPLILRRMEKELAEPDMWFVALQMLTGADPVTDEIRGDFAAMARRWLDWAAANGYAW